ncbi:MAG: YfgM family protein [Victivallaceae bacterium]
MTNDIKKGKNKKAIDAEITSTVFDDFEKFEFFFVTYWKQIIYLCVAIILGVAIVGGFIAWQQNAANKAAELFAMAQSGGNTADGDKEMTAKILAALKQYPSEPAAFGARLRLARTYVRNNEFDKAFEQYQILFNSKIPDEMRLRIRLDEAYALELSGKIDQAIAKFSDCAKDSFSPEDFRCEANFSAGRLYFQKNDLPNAKAFLTKAVNALGQNNAMQMDGGIIFWQRQANFMLNRMGGEKVAATVAAPVAAAVKNGKK